MDSQQLIKIEKDLPKLIHITLSDITIIRVSKNGNLTVIVKNNYNNTYLMNGRSFNKLSKEGSLLIAFDFINIDGTDYPVIKTLQF